MKKLRLLAIACILSICSPLFAQEFVVPVNYKLVAKEDYAPYEKDIIAASKWLQATPSNEQVDKRKETAQFVIQWITGSPNVTVNLFGPLADISKKNPDLLLVYMAAAAQYVLETGDNTNKDAQAKFALQAINKVYRAGKGISKDKKMEKIVKAEDEGKLDEWIKENFK